MCSRLAAFAAGLAFLFPFSAAGAPKVVVSVKPIHSLVAQVMEGVGEPYLLINGKASPHTYSLRPSEARRLAQADLIVWVGKELEGFLEKPVRTLGHRGRSLPLIRQPGIRRYRLRDGGVWEGHGHGHDHDDDDHKHKKAGKDHDHGRRDGHNASVDAHIWLDLKNGMAIIRSVARTLVQLDPANAGRYRTNAARAIARLRLLDARLRRQVAPVRRKPFIVFHDGYQYFERRYGLAAAGSITIDGDQPPSARRLYEVRRRIIKARVTCVFMEPQFSQKLARTVVEGTPAKLATLDPIGADLRAGPAAYAQILSNLARDLVACLR